MEKIVWHLVPAMMTGGVEVGIFKSYKALNKVFDYRIVNISGKTHFHNIPNSSLFYFLKNFSKNDIIVLSLWPSYIIGLLLFFSKSKKIPFIHSVGDYGLIKNIITKFITKIYKKGIADSKKTSQYYNVNYDIVPYFFNNRKASIKRKKIEFDIIWVGRNSEEKRFELSMKLMNFFKKKGLNVCSIIASDKIIKVKHQAYFNLNPNEVESIMLKSRLYFQLSLFEGFSMTTVEAISAGCIPLVTPVGEIPNYLDERYFIKELNNFSIYNKIKYLIETETLILKQDRISKLNKISNYIESFVKAIQ